MERYKYITIKYCYRYTDSKDRDKDIGVKGIFRSSDTTDGVTDSQATSQCLEMINKVIEKNNLNIYEVRTKVDNRFSKIDDKFSIFDFYF